MSDEYKIQDILDHRTMNGGEQYQVLWKEVGESSWERAADIPHAEITKYWSKQKEYSTQVNPEIANLADWDSLVRRVVTIEPFRGELVVFLQWNDGQRSVHSSQVARLKCPQKEVETKTDD